MLARGEKSACKQRHAELQTARGVSVRQAIVVNRRAAGHADRGNGGQARIALRARETARGIALIRQRKNFRTIVQRRN